MRKKMLAIAIVLAIGCQAQQPPTNQSTVNSQIADLESKLQKAELRALVAETALNELKDKNKREKKQMTEEEARQTVIDALNENKSQK